MATKETNSSADHLPATEATQLGSCDSGTAPTVKPPPRHTLSDSPYSVSALQDHTESNSDKRGTSDPDSTSEEDNYPRHNQSFRKYRHPCQKSNKEPEKKEEEQNENIGEEEEASEMDGDKEEDTDSEYDDKGDSGRSGVLAEVESESDFDSLEPFQPVIDAINLEALADVALEIRKTQALLSKAAHPTEMDFWDNLSCAVHSNPKAGSYSLVYIINFTDGMKWVARIPGNGMDFDELNVRAMNADYNTMRYIRATTTIPLPEVFEWETTSRKIGAPFALMSYVPGRLLCDRWFDKSWITEERRLKVLDGIASSVSQLRKHSFMRMGSLQFDEEGTPTDIAGSVWLESNGEVAWAKTHLSGPYDSLREYLNNGWDQVEDCTKRAKCCMDILSFAVDSIPDSLTQDSQFFLSPNDFNQQNIFIDDEANVVGFIDWDGTITRPSSSGVARYPSWLTRDWDPVQYGWDPENENPYESPPEALSRYRQHYAAAFERCAPDGYDPRETRVAHIIEAIDIALQTRSSRTNICDKLLDHAFHGDCPFSLKDYADAYVQDNTSAMNKQLTEAFQRMWHAEWEHEQPEIDQKDTAIRKHVDDDMTPQERKTKSA